MSNSDMFDFPTEIDMVTLGSVVELRFGNEPETTNHLISGRSSEIPEGIAELPAEIEIEDGITVSSPLGRILLDRKQGDVVELTVGNRKSTVEVVNIF